MSRHDELNKRNESIKQITDLSEISHLTTELETYLQYTIEKFFEHADEITSIEFGSKILLLFRFKDSYKTVLISSKKQRIISETTRLYSKAREIMQARANQYKSNIEYQLSTDNEKMRAWAENKGDEIFNWKKPYIKDRFGNVYLCNIEPKVIEN